MDNHIDILAEKISSRLRELERRPAWLAKETGVSTSLLTKIITHKKGNPGLDTIVKIGRALGIQPWELLKAEAVPQKSNIKQTISDFVGGLIGLEAEGKATFSEEARLLLAFGKAPPQTRSAVLETLERGVDVEAALARLRRPRQESKQEKS